MVRLFTRHYKRQTRLLDGLWQFKTDPNRIGISEEWFKNVPADSQPIVVPGCWNHELGLYHYEGAAWYFTEFETESSSINLVFHGFYGQIEVYVDGQQVGSHYGGFAGYECLVTGLTPGRHKLAVLTDNTHNNRNTIPLARVDWFHYGGLFRSVELMELNDVWIKDYKIGYTLAEDYQSAKLQIDVTLQAFGESSQQEVKVYVNDELLCGETVTVDHEAEVKLSHVLTDLKLWDPDSPNLYLVRLEIDGDDLVERIGFRDIKVENGKLLLNNNELKLKGINRHDDHPDWGFAMPFKLMKKDLDIIKNLGCNTIRGSHYPNAPVFLDLLDQEGILFWEEIPMWGFREHALADPLTHERGLSMHERMVKRDFHHPSIIMWGLHNEVDTRTQACYNLTKAFADKIRSLDPSRPLTYASFHPFDDICFELVDIISINKYFGWYEDETADWAKFLTDFKAKLAAAGLGDKPLVISEFGAGALYGENTFEGQKWSENFQADYLEYTIDLFLNDPDLAGMYIWQYCDIRSSKELEMGRPRSFNNKGIVNEYRMPKAAYWKIKELFS